MNLSEKLNGGVGVFRAIANIAGHVDDDSRVRIAALRQIIQRAEAGITAIEAEVEADIAKTLAPAPIPASEA